MVSCSYSRTIDYQQKGTVSCLPPRRRSRAQSCRLCSCSQCFSWTSLTISWVFQRPNLTVNPWSHHLCYRWEKKNSNSDMANDQMQTAHRTQLTLDIDSIAMSNGHVFSLDYVVGQLKSCGYLWLHLHKEYHLCHWSERTCLSRLQKL